MASWTATQLDAIGEAEELAIAARRPDGTLRKAVPIWVVRVGDEIYVRSYKGRGSGWFSHAAETWTGHIVSGPIDADASFEEPASGDADADADADALTVAIDEAYRTKYARFGDTYVLPMVTPAAIGAALRVRPAYTRE